MNNKDVPVQVNAGTTVSALDNRIIYLTNATADFTANGVNVHIPTGCLNLSSPMPIAGDITNARIGSLFYYMEYVS